MTKNKRVADIADEVLEPQARDRAEWTGEPFEEALKAVVETEAGRQLGELPVGTATMGHGSGRRAFSGNG